MFDSKNMIFKNSRPQANSKRMLRKFQKDSERILGESENLHRSQREPSENSESNSFQLYNTKWAESGSGFNPTPTGLWKDNSN